MKITKLFAGEDNLSHFIDVEIKTDTQHPLGNYSISFPVHGITFRNFSEGAYFDWHTAPAIQYIIYLEGTVEVTTSDGERRVFKAGDILLAADITGKGHTTKTLSSGRSVIVAL